MKNHRFIAFIILLTAVVFSACENEEERCKGEGIASMYWELSQSSGSTDTLLSIQAISSTTKLIADTASGFSNPLEVYLPTDEESCIYLLEFYDGSKDTIHLLYEIIEGINNLECGVQVNFSIDPYLSGTTTDQIDRFEINNTEISFEFDKHIKIYY